MAQGNWGGETRRVDEPWRYLAIRVLENAIRERGRIESLEFWAALAGIPQEWVTEKMEGRAA